MSRFFPIVVLIAFALPALGEPKAYELVKYRGESNGIKIAFDFADGYSQASELRITRQGHKGITFVLDEISETRFVFKDKGNAGQEVILKIGSEDSAPAKVEGVYHGANGQDASFRLTRR